MLGIEGRLIPETILVDLDLASNTLALVSRANKDVVEDSRTAVLMVSSLSSSMHGGPLLLISTNLSCSTTSSMSFFSCSRFTESRFMFEI